LASCSGSSSLFSEEGLLVSGMGFFCTVMILIG
jgi:hypothetical protein